MKNPCDYCGKAIDGSYVCDDCTAEGVVGSDADARKQLVAQWRRQRVMYGAHRKAETYRKRLGR